MEALPRELWDLILCGLARPREVAAAALVCQDFHAIITANPRIHSLLMLPRFDEQASKSVVIDEDARHAAFGETPESKAKKDALVFAYPSTDFDTAYVLPASRRNSSADSVTVVHFLIDCEPSTYFCVSVASDAPRYVAEGKAPIPEWSKDTFTASYFNDGDIHTYGAVAQIDENERKVAEFKKGDIISVQIGTRSVKTASPHAPGWERVLTLDSYQYDPATDASHDVHPYVIFFKNFAMVHHPLVMPWVNALEQPESLRIAVTFTKYGEHVRIVAPPPSSASSASSASVTFKPLLPTTTATTADEKALGLKRCLIG